MYQPVYEYVSVLSLAGCYKITTVFSHAQTVVLCVSCSTVLAQPTGGRARLTEGTITRCTCIHTHTHACACIRT